MKREEFIEMVERRKNAEQNTAKMRVIEHAGLKPEDVPGINFAGLRAAALRHRMTQLQMFELIEDGVCSYYGITSEQLKGRSRKRPLPAARKMFIILSSAITSASYSDITKRVGRGHCMAVYANKQLGEIDEWYNLELKAELAGVIERTMLRLPDNAHGSLKLMSEKIDDVICSTLGVQLHELNGGHEHLSALVHLAVMADSYGLLGEFTDNAREFVRTIPDRYLKTA